MNIESIAAQVAAEYQMTFDGVYLDFAKEVARRAVLECATLCNEREHDIRDRLNDHGKADVAYLCSQDIRALFNAEVKGVPLAERPL